MKTISARVTYSPRLQDIKGEENFYEELRYRLARRIAEELCKSDDIFKVWNDVNTDSVIIEASIVIPEKGDIVSSGRPQVEIDALKYSPLITDYPRPRWYDIYQAALAEAPKKK